MTTCVECGKQTCGYCGMHNSKGEWHCLACHGYEGDPVADEVQHLRSDLSARDKEIAQLKIVMDARSKLEFKELALDYQLSLLKSHIETLNAEKTELRLQAERDANRADKNAADYSELKRLNAKALAMLKCIRNIMESSKELEAK